MSAPPRGRLSAGLTPAQAERCGIGVRTAAYRLYDADGAMVYAGVTCNVERRMWEHKGKSWWKQVARREVTWFDSRPDALLAERGTVIDALRNAHSDASLHAAIVLAGRVGWSKYMIANELKIPVTEADGMLSTARRTGLLW